MAALPRKFAQANAKATEPKAKFKPRDNDPTDWVMGDKVMHESFGVGTVTHVFASATKLHLGIKFPQSGHKILDPRIAPMQKVD